MTDHPVKRRKKLIEVAIPLEAINEACSHEKSVPRKGHPATFHLWWARRPLAAARSVIFCQMVDDPSAVPEEFPTEEAQENERLRLFALISELVTWENTNNEEVLNRAREEIRRSWHRCCADNINHPKARELFSPEKLPGFHDPFAGGGALPLEAQRLGLETYASDLSPVAVLINKAMIEIPPKFAGMMPVNPETRSKNELIARKWKGAEGLAEDVRYYGKWVRDEAEKRIGHLFPKVNIKQELIHNREAPRPDLQPYEGKDLTVIAWIWARTAKSPSPAFSSIDVPLASTFILSSKPGKEAYVEPIIEGNTYRFIAKRGKPEDYEVIKRGTKSGGSHSQFRCILSGDPMSFEYLRNEGKAGRLGSKLLAIVAEGDRERVYLSPSQEIEDIALSAKPEWKPEVEISHWPGRTNVVEYGFTKFGDLFTGRQLVALDTISSLLNEAKKLILADFAEREGDEPIFAQNSSNYSDEYIKAVCTGIAFAISKQIDWCNAMSSYIPAIQGLGHLFTKQSIPMVWDYCEANLFSSSAGNFLNHLEWVSSYWQQSCSAVQSYAYQADASRDSEHASKPLAGKKIISVDPPYFDNIGYADLADFFYVWLRRSLKNYYPELLSLISTPKLEELIAKPARHGGKEKAEAFFLNGMKKAMANIAASASDAFPIAIYYAFKQSENKNGSGNVSTGWEAFLEAVVRSGLSVKGTWPIRTERAQRMIGQGANTLASSLVLVCVPRDNDSPILQRQEFRRKLRDSIPGAMKDLERANIAPVDVAQAAIGPGMAIFSSAKAVLNPDDSPMSVREALIEINTALDEYLSQDEGDLDADSRFALTFFESYGYEERPYGDAEGLAIARNLSVEGVAEAGVLYSVAGKVRLYQRTSLPDDWDPLHDRRLCVWEATQHLIKRLEASGEGAAAELMLQLKRVSGHGDLAANCRALAYRLYNHCEKKKLAEEARAYNGLVIAWPELERLAASRGNETAVQASLI
jgi:putative DNA methylase